MRRCKSIFMGTILTLCGWLLSFGRTGTEAAGSVPVFVQEMAAPCEVPMQTQFPGMCTGTAAPVILQADYAELYIQALEQCTYMKQRLDAGSILAVSLPSYPALEAEQLERIQSHFNAQGNEVIFSSFAQLEQEGRVLASGDNWTLPGGVYVYVHLAEMSEPEEVRVVCETACSSFISSRQSMVYRQTDGSWTLAESEPQQWQGDKKYVPVRKLLGDVDADGQVTLDDTMNILRMALKIDPATDSIFGIDMDDDGWVTLEDASDALRCALKIQKPYYYESLWENQLYADVAQADEAGIHSFDSRSEALQYVQSLNMPEAAKQLEKLNDAQLSGKRITVAASRTNAADKTHLQEDTMFHSGSRTLYTTLTEQTAVRDEVQRCYVRIYLMDEDCNMELQKVTAKMVQEVVLHVADAGEMQAENATVVCSTYDDYQQQILEKGLPAHEGINKTFFKEKALVFQYAKKVMAGNEVKNKLHVTGSQIEIENAITKLTGKTQEKNVWYIVEVPQKMAKQGNLEVKVTKSAGR